MPINVKLKTVRKNVNRYLADYRLAERQEIEEKRFLRDAKHKVSTALKAQEVLQLVAQAVQKNAHDQIAEVVTRCLVAVFGKMYKFTIEFSRKRGKTEAEPLFWKKQRKIWHPLKPLDAAGGGCVEIAALALRMSDIVLSDPKCEPVLVLDEPFRCVNGEEYRKRTAELIMTLSVEMGIQIIMATDNDWLKIGKVVNLNSPQ